MIFALRTFGCKTNQYEAEAIREQLLAGGHREVAETGAAEVLIVNTCTVTGRADATWRNAVARARRENPGVRVVLTGCAVDVNPGVHEEFQVEAVFRNQDKGLVASYFAAEAGAPMPGGEADHGAGGENAGGAHDNFSLTIGRFAGHSRAFLKIQDGCDNRCSYCVIPFARGPGRSRPQAAVLAEAARLAAAGYQEIVLTGINIGAYHDDSGDGGVGLAGLVRRLAAVPGVGRLRLGSVEPQEVTGGLIAAMAECPNVCPHLHLPLQSGSEGVLRRMNRKYGLGEFMAVLGRLRAALPRPAVTTDIIAGFPGESDAEAAETLATVRAAGFARAHVFLFSPRAGTPAAAMAPTRPGLVDARRRELTRACEEGAARYAASLVGMEENVLVESVEDGVAEGYGLRYLRVRMALPGAGGVAPRAVVRARITAAHGAELQGEILPGPPANGA